MDEIQIETIYDRGVPGVSTNPESALFRPWIRMFKTGSVIQRVTHLFLKSDFTHPGIPPALAQLDPSKYQYFILGSLGVSEKGMLCFFPGFSFEQRRFARFSDKKIIEERRDYIIDHLTLEPDYDYQRWHITSLYGPKKKRRIRNCKTRRVGRDYVYWFGLDVRNYGDLELLYKSHQFSHPLPTTDSSRRAEIFGASRRDVYQHIIEARDARVMEHPSFFHFDFCLRFNSDGKLESIPDLPLLPVSRDFRASTKGIWRRTHEIRLPGFEATVIVNATRLTGTLEENVMISRS